MCTQPQWKVFRQVLPVQVHSRGSMVNVYAVLHLRSDLTLVRKDLADHLQLTVEAGQLSLNTVGNDAKT